MNESGAPGPERNRIRVYLAYNAPHTRFGCTPEQLRSNISDARFSNQHLLHMRMNSISPDGEEFDGENFFRDDDDKPLITIEDLGACAAHAADAKRLLSTAGTKAKTQLEFVKQFETLHNDLI